MENINLEESFSQYRNRQRYFRFTIINPDSATTEEGEGFIDPLKPQDYDDFNEESGTLADYEAKSRGYLRWINLSLFLSRYGINYLQVNKLEGATSLESPSTLIFTAGFDNAEYMYYKNSKGNEYTSNDTNYEILIPTDENPRCRVLKMIVADFLINSFYGIVDVWNPELDSQGRNPSNSPIGLITPKLRATNLISSVDVVNSYVTIEEVDLPEFNDE